MTLTDLHDDLRAVARDVLGPGGSAVRGPGGSAVRGPGGSAGGWKTIAAAGWPGLEVPDALGGAGAGFAEVAVLLDEIGRAASDVGYLGTVLGVGALRLLEPSAEVEALLAATAAGDVRSAAVVGEHPPFAVSHAGGVLRIRGRAEFVPDAPDADRLLLLAADAAGTPVIVDLDPTVTTVTPQPLLDETRRFGSIEVDTEVESTAVLRFAGDGSAAVRLLFDRAATALACDSLGIMAAMLDRTADYARTREQFGRPIGSFQAVKHACADMFVQLAVARRLVALAIERTDPLAPSRAKSYVCAAAVEVAGSAMQLHGGMGYTWESGIHAYLKRATLNRALFGSPTAHRRRLATRYT